MHRPRLRATRCAGYGRDFEAAMTVTCGPLLRAARACERRADPRPVGRVGRGAWRMGPWPEVVVTILLLSAGVACMGGFPISGSLAMRCLPSAWYGAGDDDATVSAWMDAATTGDARRVARMLDEHACEVDARDSSGRTALILAAQYGHEDCCRLLVSCGARLDATSSCGFAPLPSAAAFGRESTAIFLVSAGADVNQRSLNGQTPLMLAAANGEPRLLRALMDAGAAVAGAVDGEGAGALHYAARSDGDLTLTVGELIGAAGLDVNAVDRFGQTPLMIAAEFDNPDAVRLLLSAGADPQRVDHDGRDARARAEGGSHSAELRSLLPDVDAGGAAVGRAYATSAR